MKDEKWEIEKDPRKEMLIFAISQIPVQNCDGSVSENGIKAVRYLQEICNWEELHFPENKKVPYCEIHEMGRWYCECNNEIK